jgi:hypothetical protein
MRAHVRALAREGPSGGPRRRAPRVAAFISEISLKISFEASIKNTDRRTGALPGRKNDKRHLKAA